MKVLIIRFSSFGDVLQTLSVAGRIHLDWPDAEVHWVTRAEFTPLIENHPAVRKVWSLGRGSGLGQLLQLAKELRREKFTHVYDAHNNLRSRILGLCLRRLSGNFLRRSIYRFRRFLLFKFRINLFPQPFSGQQALLEPLRSWGLKCEAPPVPQLFIEACFLGRVARPWAEDFVALAPSAAFELKRWPLENWAQLIRLFPQTKFVLLGGPEDSFLDSLAQEFPSQVSNQAGRLSLMESAAVIAQSQALVANDTGLMHVAEQIGKPCLALMGPAPFGFPSRPQTNIFEVKLSCRPCSKHGQGPCTNSSFQKCLRDITPQAVAAGLREALHA